VPDATLAQVPSNITTSGADAYLAAAIKASSGSDKGMTVYLRKAAESWYPVGIDRH
jgi:hypothetical protein